MHWPVFLLALPQSSCPCSRDDRIRERKTKINLVIFDCCRDFIYDELDPDGAAAHVDRNQRGASGTIMALTGAPKLSQSSGDQAHGRFKALDARWSIMLIG